MFISGFWKISFIITNEHILGILTIWTFLIFLIEQMNHRYVGVTTYYHSSLFKKSASKHCRMTSWATVNLENFVGFWHISHYSSCRYTLHRRCFSKFLIAFCLLKWGIIVIWCSSLLYISNTSGHLCICIFLLNYLN